jgi:hypothetical protein
MAAVVDTYSIHIYRDAMRTCPHKLKLESRLKRVSGVRKPFYVTKFGAHGNPTPGTDGPGTLPDDPPISVSARLISDRHGKAHFCQHREVRPLLAVYDSAVALRKRRARRRRVGLLSDARPCSGFSATAPSRAGRRRAFQEADLGRVPRRPVQVGDPRSRHPPGDQEQEIRAAVVPNGPDRLAKGTNLDLLVWRHDGDGRIAHKPPSPSTTETRPRSTPLRTRPHHHAAPASFRRLSSASDRQSR